MTNIYSTIQKPTMLLDEVVTKNNIKTVAQKALDGNVLLRPHFKTHQSAAIGEWFREFNINAITVSSVDMAVYFAQYGWDDITIAFPVNLLQLDSINQLADKIDLGLLVESQEIVKKLAQGLEHPVNIWIKIDSGSHRTGLAWQDVDAIKNLVDIINADPNLKLKGLLTHAGITYHVDSPATIKQCYQESIDHMCFIRDELKKAGSQSLKISVGDTPGTMLSESLGDVDEIRPGNFVLFDAMQLSFGSCTAKDIAMVVACPIVAKQPQRSEIIIYGGAIHLSKDTFTENGINKYGLVCQLHDQGWSSPIPGAYVRGLSQEHGMLYLPEEEFDKFNTGDCLGIIPAHSCLVVDLLQEYLTLTGKVIPTVNSEISKSGLI